MKRKNLYIPVAIGMCLVAGACSHKTDKTDAVALIEASDSLPVTVKKLVKGVSEDDSVGFAKIVSYPLQRPYPLRDIENEAQMRNYYKELVDDSLKQTIVTATPDRWNENGWRGTTLDDGQYVWVDENVYEVPYISQKERKNIDSLTKIEIMSLPEQLRDGWEPVLCLMEKENAHIYRIDIRKGDRGGKGHHKHSYRLSRYSDSKKLREMPDELIEGDCEEDGTAGTVTYNFEGTDGSRVSIEPETTDTGTPLLILSGDSTVELQKAYWHELIRKK